MQESDEWWEQANKDLKAAKSNFLTKEYNVASFLSQQAAEKALKALISHRSQVSGAADLRDNP